MKKSSFITVFSFLTFILSAQHFEAGLMVGASNFFGDLSKNSSIVYIQETKPSGGIFARYNINDYFAVRLSANYGILSGEDQNTKKESIRARNLSFRTSLFEAGISGEFNILGYQPYDLSRAFSPYLFAGISVFRFNPKTEYDGNKIELQPLGTEGQGMESFPDRKKYSLTQIAIPFGFGVKLALNDSWNVGLELGARKTFTDYIDDVSTSYVQYQELLAGNGEMAALLGNRQGEYAGTEPVSVPTGTARGDNNSSDWYFILGATISYNFFDTGLSGVRNKSRKRSGCN
ncbi:MAG: porin family protein [Bacteroidetes bacterium]|nr:porin family protein [Bacteroidota bacterium]